MRSLARPPAALAVVAAFAAGGCGAAHHSEAAPPAIQARVRQLVQAGAPGAVVYARHGEHTFAFAAGVADRSGSGAMKADAVFRIGSLTKSYVAAVVLQLVGEGKLSLRDPVERYLPRLLPDGKRITVRELLNHTSGVFDYVDDERFIAPYRSGHLDVKRTPLQLVRLAATHARRGFAPGTQYSYSNTNYVLLGLIVERVTGNPIEEELSHRVFRPLHLGDTSFGTDASGPSTVHGYYYFQKPPGRRDVTRLTPSFGWAAGAIDATGEDVADFYHGLLSGRLLSPALLRAMKRTVAEQQTDQRYGLGLERYVTACGIAWGHTGNFPGYLAIALSSASAQRQAVLLVNEDPTALPVRAQNLLSPLIQHAYCDR